MGDAVLIDERAARLEMGVVERLLRGEDGVDAGVGAVEQRRPVRAGLAGEGGFEQPCGFGPCRLALQVRRAVAGNAERREQLRPELRLDRADGDLRLLAGSG